MECVEREFIGFFRADEATRRVRLVARCFYSSWRIGDYWVEPVRCARTGGEPDVGQEWGARVQSDYVDGGLDPDVVGSVTEGAKEWFFNACKIVESGVSFWKGGQEAARVMYRTEYGSDREPVLKLLL